jgi:hypothetical protein
MKHWLDEIDSVLQSLLGGAQVLQFKRRDGFEPDWSQYLDWCKQHKKALNEYKYRVKNTNRGLAYLDTGKGVVNTIKPPFPWYRYRKPMVVTIVRDSDV